MSRYAKTPLCETTSETGIRYHDIIQLQVPTYTQDFQLVTVNRAYVKRFDLLVKNIYGSAENDWHILWNNNLACTFDLIENMTLIFGK